MKRLHRFIVLFFCCFPLLAGETITDDPFGYTITLPDNWVREISSSTHHRFIDTTGNYQSMVVISRYDFGGDTIYNEPTAWPRANFIAYELTINADPLCALIFYDSTTVKQNDTLWTADAYTYYYDVDSTVGEWAEYIRFTAITGSGFELYALGPIADMDSNIVFYASIIDGITLHSTNDGVIRPMAGRRMAARASLPSIAPYRMNLLGRRIRAADDLRASQMIVSPRRKVCLIR